MFRPNENNNLIRLTNQSLLNIRNSIRSKFDEMVEGNRSEKVYLLWCEIKKLWRELDVELRKREEAFHKLSEKKDFGDSEEEKRFKSYTPNKIIRPPANG